MRRSEHLAQPVNLLSRSSASQHGVAAADKLVHHGATEAARGASDEDDFATGHEWIVPFNRTGFQSNSYKLQRLCACGVRDGLSFFARKQTGIMFGLDTDFITRQKPQKVLLIEHDTAFASGLTGMLEQARDTVG